MDEIVDLARERVLACVGGRLMETAEGIASAISVDGWGCRSALART
jgi:hypothetical protein